MHPILFVLYKAGIGYKIMVCIVTWSAISKLGNKSYPIFITASRFFSNFARLKGGSGHQKLNTLCVGESRKMIEIKMKDE